MPTAARWVQLNANTIDYKKIRYGASTRSTIRKTVNGKVNWVRQWDSLIQWAHRYCGRIVGFRMYTRRRRYERIASSSPIIMSIPIRVLCFAYFELQSRDVCTRHLVLYWRWQNKSESTADPTGLALVAGARAVHHHWGERNDILLVFCSPHIRVSNDDSPI